MIGSANRRSSRVAGCLIWLLKAYTIVFCIVFQSFVGYILALCTTASHKAVEADTVISTHRALAIGEVTRVERENHSIEERASDAYTVHYRFTLPSGQKYVGKLTNISAERFQSGQPIRVEYDSRDPMRQRLQGRTLADRRVQYAVYFILLLAAILPGAVLIGRRKRPEPLSKRLIGAFVLLLCSMFGYAKGNRGIGSNDATSSYSLEVGKRYTFQIDDEVSEGTTFRSDALSLAENRLTARGKTYPMPPNHAHIWLKKGRLYVNNVFQP